jgi:two-component system, NarL family, response regulator LiaR
MQIEPIRVVIVDDHAVVRRGLTTFLDVFDDMELIGHAGNGIEAIQLCKELQPDIVLMDVVMPEMGGIEATRAILANSPDIRIIALTSFDDEEKIREMLAAGATGYMLKNSSIDDLAHIVRAAHVGASIALSPEVTNKLLHSTGKTESAEPVSSHNLSPRELEVLSLLVDGLSNREIARDLTISLGTVKTHVSMIIAKLEVNNRVEAATLAVRQNIVARPPDLAT